VLISLLVFITAFIPIFGPYISGALGIILVYSQDAALIWWFLLIFFIVQQVSGSLIYPRIMASAIDLPSIWVLVSVTVGGGLMGLAGILFFIPFTAVLYNLLGEDVARRHALKNQTPDMRHA
jgi:predicted PurR-regulated permease PerM